MHCDFSHGKWVIQTGEKALSLCGRKFQFDSPIFSFKLSGNYMVVLFSSSLRLLLIEGDNLTAIHDFPRVSFLFEVIGNKVITITDKKMLIMTIDSTREINLLVKSEIIRICINGKFLAILAKSGEIKVFNILSEIIQPVYTAQFKEVSQISNIKNIGISRNGQFISLTFTRPPKIWVYSFLTQQYKTFEEYSTIIWDSCIFNLVCIQSQNSVFAYYIEESLEMHNIGEIFLTNTRKTFKSFSPHVYSYSVKDGMQILSHVIPSLTFVNGLDIDLKRKMSNLHLLIIKKDIDSVTEILNQSNNQIEVNLMKKFLNQSDISNSIPNIIKKQNQENETTYFFDFELNKSLINKPQASKSGRFFEVNGKYEEAVKAYVREGEIKQAIRLLCMHKCYEEAERLSRSSTSLTCYYAMILLKSKDAPVDMVLEVLIKGSLFNDAIEYAFNHENDLKVLELSSRASKNVVSRIAEKYEAQQKITEAIHLYLTCLRINKVCQLCLDHQQYELLDQIAIKVTKADKNLLQKCASALENHEKWQSSVSLYIAANCINKAILISSEHQIILTESELSYLMSNPSNESAILCSSQKEHFYSAKIYISLGDYISAIKEAQHLDNVSELIKLAKSAKSDQAIEMVADYISSMHPLEGSTFFNKMVMFYEQINKHEKIVEYVQKAAKYEIDTNGRYERALSLLEFGYSMLAKIPDSKEQQRITNGILKKISWIKIYLDASNYRDEEQIFIFCSELLENEEAKDIISSTDLRFLIAKYYLSKEEFSSCVMILEQMRNQGIDLTRFFDSDSLCRIYRCADQKYLSYNDDDLPSYPTRLCNNVSDSDFDI